LEIVNLSENSSITIPATTWANDIQITDEGVYYIDRDFGLLFYSFDLEESIIVSEGFTPYQFNIIDQSTYYIEANDDYSELRYYQMDLRTGEIDEIVRDH